jgi:hypothetical protein
MPPAMASFLWIHLPPRIGRGHEVRHRLLVPFLDLGFVVLDLRTRGEAEIVAFRHGDGTGDVLDIRRLDPFLEGPSVGG